MKKFKTLFTCLLALLLLTSMAFAVSALSKNPFEDVKSSSYYFESVMWAYENNITTGMSATKFEPNLVNTRGQMVTFLWRCAGCPEIEDVKNVFTDVDNSEYYAKAVLWALREGITDGVTPTEFDPDGKVTRGQTVTFLYRYENPKKYDKTNVFHDVKESDFWYDAVLWASSTGLTKGIDKTHFAPKEYCKRCEIVTFLYRLCGDRGIIMDNGNRIDKLLINDSPISDYVIACNTSAGGVINNAANELQKYIKSATGEELEIKTSPVASGTKRIYINETLENDPDNFHYFSDEDGITIAGSAKRSALYAVYNFLEEQLGWRFFADDTEICYKSRLINLKEVNKNYEASFEIRDVYWTEAFNDSFSVKRMLNGEGKRHMNSEWGGIDGFTGSGCHTFDELSESGGVGISPNPCLSDETIYQTMLKNVRAKLAANPDARMISVSQNDNRAHCQCEKCLAKEEKYGSPAGPIVEFVNRIARDVKTDYPNVLIVTFAYDYSRKCPKNIVCEDNVMIELCSVECCFKHALDDPDCSINSEFIKDFEGWSKICKQMYIWDYTIDFRYYQCPFPNFDVLLENAKLFKKFGVVGVLEQGNYQAAYDTTLGKSFSTSGEFGALRSYLLAKVLENPDMSKEDYYQCMDEFLEAYYGKGWKYVRKFIDFVTELANKQENEMTLYSTPEDIYGPHPFTPMNDTLVKWFDKAEQMAETELQLLHVRRSRMCCDWIRIGSIFYQEYRSGDENRKAAIVAQVEDLYNRFLEFHLRLGENYPLEPQPTFKKNPRRWSTWYSDYKE